MSDPLVHYTVRCRPVKYPVLRGVVLPLLLCCGDIIRLCLVTIFQYQQLHCSAWNSRDNTRIVFSPHCCVCCPYVDVTSVVRTAWLVPVCQPVTFTLECGKLWICRSGVRQWRPQTMTTNLVKFLQRCQMSLTVHLALVFHVFIAVAVIVMVCGRHGSIGPTNTIWHVFTKQSPDCG